MKHKRSTQLICVCLIAIIIVCVILLAVRIARHIPSGYSEEETIGLLETDAGQNANEPISEPNTSLQQSNQTVDSQTPAALPEEPYISPIDFEALWEVNTDVVAYLDVPNTPIHYPILHRSGDNNYYLRRNLEGEYSLSGSVFIEDYNEEDFNDPVTVIYGHNMRNEEFFGTLQRHFSDTEWFKENTEITIYLPDRILTYTVKAAVPYSSLHILYYYDFEQVGMFRSFIESIYRVRSIDANFSETAVPIGDNPIIVLSTCLNGNSHKRYLVVAEQSADSTTEQEE